MPFLAPFLGEGSPTQIDCRKKVGTLLLTSLLEDLVEVRIPETLALFRNLGGHRECRKPRGKDLQRLPAMAKRLEALGGIPRSFQWIHVPVYVTKGLPPFKTHKSKNWSPIRATGIQYREGEAVFLDPVSIHGLLEGSSCHVHARRHTVAYRGLWFCLAPCMRVRKIRAKDAMSHGWTFKLQV